MAFAITSGGGKAGDVETWDAPSYRLTIEMTPEAHAALMQLARDSGQGVNDVIRSALGMYKLAVEAHRAEKSVGIAPTPESMETVFF